MTPIKRKPSVREETIIPRSATVVTPRLTPRDMMPSGGKSKGGAGFLKSGVSTFDKFTAINKKDAMKDQKDADDKKKRED
jgi:hypothetical protein